MARMWEWIKDHWEALVLLFYWKTSHYWEGQMHDALCHSLLDELGAPKRRPESKLNLGVYGRLRYYAETKGINHDPFNEVAEKANKP